MPVTKDLRKKVKMQNIIIIALALTIVLLVAVSTTAAWYIRTKSDTADIVFSDPVEISITENNKKTIDILEEYQTRVYPGDEIKLNLGVVLGEDNRKSSPAYVRVKLTITYEKYKTGEEGTLEELEKQSMLEYKDTPDANVWERIDFNKFKTSDNGEEVEEDYWFVLKTTDEQGKTVSRIATNEEYINFIDGNIKLSKSITNAQANCLFHVKYIVEAIQTEHVPDPIVHQGYGPWWDFIKGDEDDLV